MNAAEGLTLRCLFLRDFSSFSQHSGDPGQSRAEQHHDGRLCQMRHTCHTEETGTLRHMLFIIEKLARYAAIGKYACCGEAENYQCHKTERRVGKESSHRCFADLYTLICSLPVERRFFRSSIKVKGAIGSDFQESFDTVRSENGLEIVGLKHTASY